MVTPERVAHYERIVRSVGRWASGRPDIIAIAVVGSWARRQAGMDSDIDLVILTDDELQYQEITAWVEAALGEVAELARTGMWGPLTERRVVLASGLEIDFGFTSPSWARIDPVDSGTRKVVNDGCLPVLDTGGHLARVIAAADNP